MSEVAAAPGAPSAAKLRRARPRIPVIWIIPLVAVAIAAWLAWDTLSKEGPTIRVSFESAEGLQAGQSQLKFKDITLGTVKALTLTSDHSRVVATVSTTREAESLLSDQTVFWVVKPRLFAGSLSGLGTLISGSYIGMLPGKTAGKAQLAFVGAEDPPVLESNVPGRTFLVKADRLGSISLGSPIFFRDIEAGQVLGWDLGDMATSATIHVFVREPFDKYVHDNTRFWNASGLSVKLGSGGIDVQVASLRAMLLGGIAFDTPAQGATGQVSVADHTFPLYANQDSATAASFGRKIPFIAYFDGSVRGLAVGADVTLRGLKVGQVTAVDLTYDRAKDAIVAPVAFEVEPERFVGIGKRAYANPGEGIRDLVSRGMRATLQSASLITGQMLVALEVVPDAPAAEVAMQGDAFVVPTTSAGGFSGLATAATDLLAKVNEMPFGQIGETLQGTLHGLDNMVNGPQLKQMLSSLTTTVIAAQNTLHQLDNGVTPVMRKLPDIAANLDRTMTGANKLVLSLDSGYGDNTKFNRDLDRLMVQLNEAVQSIHTLTDLLSRHPEALIRGRTNEGVQ